MLELFTASPIPDLHFIHSASAFTFTFTFRYKMTMARIPPFSDVSAPEPAHRE